jgi:hypothetical protein
MIPKQYYKIILTLFSTRGKKPLHHVLHQSDAYDFFQILFNKGTVKFVYIKEMEATTQHPQTR